MTNLLKPGAAKSVIRATSWIRSVSILFALAAFAVGCSPAARVPAAAQLAGSSATRPSAGDPRVDVIFWFDTEDYLLPADDDAAKRLAVMLDQRHIKATFKVVGEKARVLEQRHRDDVIAALKKHDIGYHSNFHSVHPTPTEYLAYCNWLDGVGEFVRRETRGAADVKRVFGVPWLACYGQPGSSWGSQTIGGLKQIGVAPHGVPCYVDEGTHVGGFDGKPFWYCNALVVYDMKPNVTRMDLKNPDGLKPAEKEFSQIADRLRGEGGGLVSIYYHPCEWVHQTFWDGVNFGRGANPPREQWKAPPQKPPEETEALFARYGRYVDFIRNTPNIHFITASELPVLYADPLRSEGASLLTVTKLAQRIAESCRTGGPGIDILTVDGLTFSPADQFELITAAASARFTGHGPASNQHLMAKGLFGPDGPSPEKNPLAADQLAWTAVRDTLADVRDYVEKNGRVPPRVFIGPDPISPTDFLATLASWYDVDARSDKIGPEGSVRLIRDVPLATVSHIAKDTPNLFGAWVIHRANYRAPHVMEVARWQAWTLKPATRVTDNGKK